VNADETRTLRYETIVAMLKEILDRLAALERDVDELDRGLRPYGDGTRLLPRRSSP
jgi:hypothetical protein